jgi:hypothetical protein
MFEPPYCRALIELGYRDTLARSEELLALLEAPSRLLARRVLRRLASCLCRPLGLGRLASPPLLEKSPSINRCRKARRRTGRPSFRAACWPAKLREKSDWKVGGKRPAVPAMAHQWRDADDGRKGMRDLDSVEPNPRPILQSARGGFFRFAV